MFWWKKMITDKTITVLMCVHSRTDMNDNFLKDALLSVYNQTHKDYKVILLLDECWDKTKFIVENMISEYFSDHDFMLIEKDKKEGLAKAKNYALPFVDTEYVAFLDADDLYEPTKLEKQVKFLENNDVDFLATHSWNTRSTDRSIKCPSCFDENTYITHEEIKNVIHQENVIAHGSLVVRTEAFKELGYYKHRLGIEDWDLWIRAIEGGYIFHQLPERLYVWCEGSSVAR